MQARSGDRLDLPEVEDCLIPVYRPAVGEMPFEGRYGRQARGMAKQVPHGRPDPEGGSAGQKVQCWVIEAEKPTLERKQGKDCCRQGLGEAGEIEEGSGFEGSQRGTRIGYPEIPALLRSGPEPDGQCAAGKGPAGDGGDDNVNDR